MLSEDDEISEEILRSSSESGMQSPRLYNCYLSSGAALLLNSSGAYYGQQPSPADPNKTNSMGNDPTQAVFESIASALYYAVNVVFLVFQRIPCISDSVFPQDWRCCQCDCRGSRIRNYECGILCTFNWFFDKFICVFRLSLSV